MRADGERRSDKTLELIGREQFVASYPRSINVWRMDYEAFQQCEKC